MVTRSGGSPHVACDEPGRRRCEANANATASRAAQDKSRLSVTLAGAGPSGLLLGPCFDHSAEPRPGFAGSAA
jgi:hypothetical protein